MENRTKVMKDEKRRFLEITALIKNDEISSDKITNDIITEIDRVEHAKIKDFVIVPIKATNQLQEQE